MLAPPAEASGIGHIVQMTTGLWISQTLVAAVELDLFTFLSARQAATVSEISAAAGIADRPAEILVTACAALGLLVHDGGSFRNSPEAEEYLVHGKPYYFGDYVNMLSKYAYSGWMRITDAVRSNSPSKVVGGEQQEIFDSGTRPRLFWDGLHPLSALTGRALAAAVDFSGTASLLDVGGGSGAFAIELCRRYPHMRATVFDLPFVCEYAAGKLREAGMADRIQPRAGDFTADEGLPGEHDTILLSMILHDWDESANRELLRKCYQALPAGGTLVISELLVNDEKTGPLDAALMSMNMLVGTWGRNYTAAEYRDWLRAAGFRDVRTISLAAPAANGAIVARKP